MANYNSYVHCFVPNCRNTSFTAPDKLFFNVPMGKKRRDWLKAVGRGGESLSLVTPARCCADHFIVEEDVSNWWRYKIMKDAGQKHFRLRLKPDVIPHIFDVSSKQPDEDSNDSDHSKDNETTSCFQDDDIEPLEFVDVTISCDQKSIMKEESRIDPRFQGKEECGSNLSCQVESTSNITEDTSNKSEYIDISNLCSQELIIKNVCDEPPTKDFSCQTNLKPRLQFSKMFSIFLPPVIPEELDKRQKKKEMGVFFYQS